MPEATAENRPGKAPPPADGAASPAAPTDVWSWRARKYRVRATVLLLVNLGLFCGLCIFTHWLHFAQPFDFSPGSYIEPLRFWGPQTQSLYDFILYRISVDQTPIYGVVVGLLLASIVGVPISVSILYRFLSALPFVAAVLIFAHMPWMAVTLVGSCILASVRPFRMSFRFGSALVGMLPVLLYLYLATRGAAEPLSASVSPERKLLLIGPWLLAILAACTMLAVIIFLAHVVRYRPGAVAPVMAVMFATPAILFHVHVGVDELTYRVLELEYGPRSKHFEPVQDATENTLDFFRRQVERGMDRAAQRAVLLALSSEHPEQQIAAVKRGISSQLLIELMSDRRQAYQACKDFIADHPASRFVPSVLFIQARALDIRLDELQFIGESVQRELYTDFPHVQSEPVWTNLLTQYPDSPLAVAACLRVAQLRLRKGDAQGALAALAASAQAGGAAWPADTQPAARRLLRSQPPESSLDFEPDEYLMEAERLRELILANQDDARYGIAPLQALACLDLHRTGYRDQLRRLAHEYSDSLLYDNLVVLWANADPNRQERAAKLRACTLRFPDGDALPEAMFRLADLEAFGSRNEANVEAGTARMQALVTRFGQTHWARLAAERLKMLQPQSRPTTQVAVSP